MGTTSGLPARATLQGETADPSLDLGPLGPRIVLFFVGFSPITVLALSLLEVVPLHVVGPPVITAAPITTAWSLARRPALRPVVLQGLAGGLIAVLVYDATRLPFVVGGGWPDFIPKIGAWLLDDHGAHWSIGYLWRYLGNGAGMGLAFATFAPALRRWLDLRVAGILYGISIWSGLLSTLILAPNGQAKMFSLTLPTFSLSLLGHLIYGGVLGHLASGRWGQRLDDGRTPQAP